MHLPRVVLLLIVAIYLYLAWRIFDEINRYTFDFLLGSPLIVVAYALEVIAVGLGGDSLWRMLTQSTREWPRLLLFVLVLAPLSYLLLVLPYLFRIG